MQDRTEILVALDYADLAEAEPVMRATKDKVDGYKFGLTTLAAYSAREIMEWCVKNALAAPWQVFIDPKLHDIPEQVERAVAVYARLGMKMFTIHASGGPAMMRAAVRSCAKHAKPGQKPLVLAVTVLTSIDPVTCKEVYHTQPPEQVKRLAEMAVEAGVDGIVCSPQEIEIVAAIAPGRKIVTPGIRPASGQVINDDQQRTATPKGARDAGSTHLVIGRPITQASDPAQAVDVIITELAE